MYSSHTVSQLHIAWSSTKTYLLTLHSLIVFPPLLWSIFFFSLSFIYLLSVFVPCYQTSPSNKIFPFPPVFLFCILYTSQRSHHLSLVWVVIVFVWEHCFSVFGIKSSCFLKEIMYLRRAKVPTLSTIHPYLTPCCFH